MQPLPSSYRDRDGFVFKENGQVLRLIHQRYLVHYSNLMNSGLYSELVKSGKLIAHKEVSQSDKIEIGNGKLIHPEQIPFISYPYEWSFTMWQDAALLTLQIASQALKKDMILKDASPFNIQFLNSKPVFIDTLSLENYEPGEPWIAYRQFCECFLAPLLLMHYNHPGAQKLFTIYPNGIPLEVLVALLPKRSKWNINTYLHIHLQSKLTGRKRQQQETGNYFPKQKSETILKGLESFVKNLSVKKTRTTWEEYYTCATSDPDYLEAKAKLVNLFLKTIKFESVIDLGANKGHYSLLVNNSKNVIAVDADPNCINDLYLKIKKEKINNLLPLVIDLISPSPAIGWNNAERDSITQRLKADLVLALALVHHLAIANNLPLALITDWLCSIAGNLIIEFVPKEDEKVKLLLQNRKDIFDDYTPENFKLEFGKKYNLVKEEKIGNTERILFLMKRK